jgi:hypothetical protein
MRRKVKFIFCHFLILGCSMAGHSTHKPHFKGSNPATAGSGNIQHVIGPEITLPYLRLKVPYIFILKSDSILDRIHTVKIRDALLEESREKSKMRRKVTFLFCHFLSLGCSMARHSTHKPHFKGSNPATARSGNIRMSLGQKSHCLTLDEK